MKFYIKKIDQYYVLFYKYKSRMSVSSINGPYVKYNAAKRRKLELEREFGNREDLQDFK